MKELFDYLFKPFKHDREAVKSAYRGSLRPTHVMLSITFIMCLLFLLLSFIRPDLFGETVFYHRICYAILFVATILWFIHARHAALDYENRYRTVFIVNAVIGSFTYAWAIGLAFVNLLVRKGMDTTIFMTVSLIVPLCVYLNPLEYILIALLSNAAMIFLLFSAPFFGWEYSFTNSVNFVVFSIFQIAMGVTMLYTKYRLHKQIVTAARQHDEIEMLNKAQNRFFSNMSHEIRTPINTIIGLNEMILRENVSEEVAEDAANIKAAGKLLLNLINDILDMSKIQSGKMQLTYAPYRSGNMLSDIVGMLWIRAKEKKLEFHVDVSPDVPAELVGDEVRVKQILINVLNNAIKYTKEGSVSLSVQCERKENKVCNVIYTVSDTGIGIKTEDIPYLFSAFKRVDENATRHIEGTGLGLSIVKQLVDLMGGKVTVNSVYTKGSTFIIEIPQRIEREGNVGEYDFTKIDVKSRPEYVPKFEAPEARILVVDDNEANLMVVSKLLRDTKVRIDTVNSGAEALKRTLNVKYDVIFMDHLMPEMDGIECHRRIKEQTGGRCRETSVVILTANADEESKALYAKENFDGYLSKPVSGDELENELYQFLPKERVRITGHRTDLAEETISWMNANKQRKSVVITTESVADLSPEIIEKYGISVLPHRVKTADGIFKDGKEIETRGVLKYMEDPNHSVMPVVKDAEEFFAKLLAYANNVIHVSISSKLENSGYGAALEASKSFDNVFVVDSAHLSSGQGLLAIEACRLAEEGMSAEEIIQRLGEVQKKIHTSFIVDNLDFLARAGQVSNRIANIVKSLMGRPVLRLRKGKMGVGRTFFGSRENAWRAYINSILSSGKAIDTRILFVTYVGLSKRDVDWIRAQIEKKMKFDEIIFKQASPAIAVNCGPGTFGLLYREKD